MKEERKNDSEGAGEGTRRGRERAGGEAAEAGEGEKNEIAPLVCCAAFVM